MMSFRTAVVTCIRKYFRMSGRASRAEYWWFTLFCALLLLASAVLEYFLIGPQTLLSETGGPITIAVNLLTWIPSFTALIRRMHEINLRGYFLLAPVAIAAVGIGIGAGAGPTLGTPTGFLVGAIIFAGILLQLYWLVRRSDPHTNRFGPPPNGVFS